MRDAGFQAAADAASIKAGAAVTGFGAILAWEAPVAVLGVPVAVLLAALTGALLGVIYDKPFPTRRALIAAVAVNTLLGAVVAMIVPHAPLMHWLKPAPDGAIALVLAFAARWAVPAAVERIPTVLERLLGRALPKRKEDA